jgi:hypothetical protein
MAQVSVVGPEANTEGFRDALQLFAAILLAPFFVLSSAFIRYADPRSLSDRRALAQAR